MTKKVSKGAKRRWLLMSLITIIILSAFSLNIYDVFSKVIIKNNEALSLKREIKRLADEEQYLKVEVEKLNDPDYVARYARERYLYSRNGEFTIRIKEAQ